MARARRPLGGLLPLLALILVGCASTGNTASPTATASRAAPAVDGTYASGSCPFSVSSGFVEGQNVLCGTLTVPEDHAKPADPKVKLAIATFKSPSAHPAPDPVIFLQGGPGGRIIQDLAGAIMNSDPASRLDLQQQFGNHDLVLVDQRGTGYSTPALACPEVDRLQFVTDVNYTPRQIVDLQNQAIAQCHDRLVKQGIHLGAYTTYNDAYDIYDLDAALVKLGYPQVDLYGVSYGTRLTLEIMRSFPQHVRSVILDSTVPPQLRLLTSIPGDTTRVFDTLFKGCAADPGCNARYPNLDSVFAALYTSLNAHPVTFDATDLNVTGKTYTVLFHGDDLVNLLFTSFYLTQAIPLLPEMLYQLKDGTTSDASLLYGALIFDDSIGWGVYYSVECAEDVDFTTTAQLNAAGQAYIPVIRANQLTELAGEIPGCKEWNVATVPTAESDPVTSALPTLVMESEYDPITPPSNGDLVAKNLTHAYKFLFPGVGHGAMLFNNCPTTIAIAFWSDPSHQPDGSCIATMGEPQFR